jgi:hypothetical protein
MRSSCFIGLVLLVAASCGKSNGLLPPPDAGGPVALPPAATCTGTPVAATAANPIDSVGEDLDATCAAAVGFLDWKMGATGSPCTAPSDCSPVCVLCPTGPNHTLAAWCDGGHCAAPSDIACAVAGTPLKSCS